jgi:hypothetical protein
MNKTFKERRKVVAFSICPSLHVILVHYRVLESMRKDRVNQEIKCTERAFKRWAYFYAEDYTIGIRRQE